MKLLFENWRKRIKEYDAGLAALHFSKNIPGSVLPDDEEEAQEREELKKLKEKSNLKSFRISFKKKKSGGCV
jgi:hypothetical protein